MTIRDKHTIDRDNIHVWATSYSMRFMWYKYKSILDVAYFRDVAIDNGTIYSYRLTWRNEKCARVAEFYRNSLTGIYTVTVSNKLYIGAHTYTEKVLEQSAFYLGDAMRIIRKHYNDN